LDPAWSGLSSKYFTRKLKPFTVISLKPLSEKFVIYQLNDADEIPEEIFQSSFYSVTRTMDEVSVVTSCEKEFPNLKSNSGWKAFRVEGILDFSLTGILYQIIGPLKENGISVFVISTYNTDYVLVKETSFEQAIELLNSTDGLQINRSSFRS
jgi:hypothetical protein